MTEAFRIVPLSRAAAVVTGGTSGMGLAAARALLEAGTRRLVIVGRNPERGQRALAALEELAPAADIRFVAADVGTEAGAEAAIAGAVEGFGGIDILVNGAGADGLPTLFHETSYAYIERILRNLLMTTILPCRAAIEPMMAGQGGVILCIASDAAKVATPGETVIGTAYGGVAMFCRALAMEAKRHGIRVNCLTPSVVRDTIHYEQAMADPFAGKLFSAAERRATLGTMVPDDLGPLVVFLAGPGAAKITGQTISMNAGISAA